MFNDAQTLFNLFGQLKISYDTVSHEPFYTAEAMDAIDLSQWNFPVKNFFVYDKKKQFFLITVHLELPPVDLKALSKSIGAKGGISFAREEHLKEKLKVLPGSVTPYAIHNDTAQSIQVILDKNLKESPSISAHPMSNDQTTTISLGDLHRLYKHTGHTPQWVEIPLKD